MVEESIVFSPEISDRELDREVDQVNSALDSAGQMSLDVDDSGLGDLGPDGFGGIGGGGMGGMGGAAAAGGVASKLPSAVGGVTMGSVLPVALGGAIGVGLLSKMTEASGHLSATMSIFGIAVNQFLRPIATVLSEHLRPMAKDWLNFSSDFANIVESDGLAVGIAWATKGALDGIVASLGDLVTGKADAGDLITITASTWAASKLMGISASTWAAAKIIGISSSIWSAAKIISISAGTWAASKLLAIGSTLTAGAASLITLGTAITVGAGALIAIGSVMTLDALELIDIGAVIRADWDDVVTLHGSIPFEIGQDVAVEGENNPLRSDETDVTDPGLETGVIDPRKVPILSDAFWAGRDLRGLVSGLPFVQGGGRVTQSGPAVVHRDEIIADPDRLVNELASAIDATTGGGGGAEVDLSTVERKLDRLNRNLKRLASAMQDTSIQVDGDEFGRLAAGTQADRVFDTDPMAD